MMPSTLGNGDRDSDLDEILSRHLSKSSVSIQSDYGSMGSRAPSHRSVSSSPRDAKSSPRKLKLTTAASPRTKFLQTKRDVSYLRDTPKRELCASLPPSLIPESEMVLEKTMFPPEDKNRQCWYDPDEKVYVSVAFPSQRPTGRHDVALLEEWLTRALGEDEWMNNVNDENRNQIVRDQLAKLQIGFREIVRQVTVTCAERGQLLDRIWKSTSSLLEYVMKQMQTTILTCQQRMEQLNLRAGKHESDLLNMKNRHEEELKILSQTIGHKWGQRIESVKQALIDKEMEARRSQESMALLKIWFPSFHVFAPTVLNSLLPAKDPTSSMEMMVLPPEEALKNDIKRVIESTIFDMKFVKDNESEDEDGEDDFGNGAHKDKFPFNNGLNHTSLEGDQDNAHDTINKMQQHSPSTHAHPQRRRSSQNRKESIFRSLMTASREYQNEIDHLNSRVRQLEKERDLDKIKFQQQLKESQRKHAYQHNLIMKSTITKPLTPNIQPHGYHHHASKHQDQHHHFQRDDSDGKIINAGRVQRECIRFIKSYAIFMDKRTTALLTGNIRNSNTWWMLKIDFGDFVKQQVLLRNPDNFHDSKQALQILERSALHWAGQHDDEGTRRQMTMYSKLMNVSKTPYTPREAALWLTMSNKLHEYFRFAYNDFDALPITIIPVTQAEKVFRDVLVGQNHINIADLDISIFEGPEGGGGGLRREKKEDASTEADTNIDYTEIHKKNLETGREWRCLPKAFITSIDEEIAKKALKYESLHIEIFEFFEVVLHAMHSFESELRQALVYLCMVASGNDEVDSLSYFEFDVIIDIVEPSLPPAMRNTLFHLFAGAAFLKEGKKWEANAFADTLIEYSLPLERLVAVYIMQQYQIAEALELKSISVIKNAENLLNDIAEKNEEEDITEEEDEEHEILIDQLKGRVEQVKKLIHECEQENLEPQMRKKHVDIAYLSCLFLEQESKAIQRQFLGGGITEGAATSGNHFLAHAITFDRTLLQKKCFRRWIHWKKKQEETRRKASVFC